MPLIHPLKNTVALQYEKSNLWLQAECESVLEQSRIIVDWGELITPVYAVFSLKSGYRFSFSKLALNAGLAVINMLNKAYYERLDWAGLID